MLFTKNGGLEKFEKAVESNICDDGYGSSGILYAAMWAGAMEREIVEGKLLHDVARECSREADDALGRFGITGFQYGMAVALLSECWVYGEELRRWHNLETQIHDEGERANESGGVLNPALMTISTPDEDTN